MSDKINDFAPETASLLASLIAAGFKIHAGSNGEESRFERKGMPESEFLAELLGCDEAWLYVSREATKESVKTPGKMVKKLYTLYLVYGNSPGELVADWSVPGNVSDAQALSDAISAHSREWEGKKQPQIVRGT